MPTKWLIQRGVGPDDKQAAQFTAAIRKLGMEAIEAKYVPMGGGFETKKKLEFTDEDCVLFIGTIQMYKFLYRTTKWAPLGWVDFDKLRCHVYYDHYGQYLLDPNYIMLPLRELIRRQDEIYASMGDGKFQIFIRPDDNAKSFDGEVVAQGQLPDWLSYVTSYTPDVHTVCVISRVQEILAEWRFVIADRRVVDGSQYRLEGSVEYEAGFEPGAGEFAEKVASQTVWQPHPIYCMDIAKTRDGYKLIEIGGVNVAGLYECKLELIIKKMAEIAEREQKELLT